MTTLKRRITAMTIFSTIIKIIIILAAVAAAVTADNIVLRTEGNQYCYSR